ncbi:MAG: NADH-quinone oxidoreductase subunit NuoE [Myxococcota bacterium]
MVISKATREKIDTEIAKYPQRRGGLLPALRWIQAESGYVSPDASREAAEIFGIHPVEVMEVVRFYNMLYSEPQGRHHVHVCTNLPCSLRGARILLRQLETHLGVQAGETTPDGRITLGHEECLGACAYAPMMRVDSIYHEDLDGERAKKIVDALD